MVSHTKMVNMMFLVLREQVFDCIAEYREIEADKKYNPMMDGEREEELSQQVDTLIEGYNFLKKEKYHHPDMAFIGAFCTLAEHERGKEEAKSIPITDI